ncbi:Pkinase-domain-containing protein, partial [Martensiomyces pterosporus]
MYVRQHPTYRRLSAHFTKSNRGAYNDRQQHRQTRRDDSHAATSHDFTSWERIGRGGFGKVYRVRPRHPSRYPDLPSSGYLAIKIVDKRALKDSAAEQRLAAEVAIHECLDHPSIVRIYDSFEDDRLVYIVMEYCAGGDLWRYLRQRHLHASQLPNSEGAPQLSPLSEAEARHVMRQVSSAVAYLHSLGVLHRDLKLANMMLSENMDVKVGDFGLATWIRGDNTMEPTTLCGTPSYISPEILARQPYSFESDIWALGCLFVTLLTGSQPFRGSGRITEEAVAQIRLPSDISQEARRLIRALLRIDPRRRIRSSELPDHPFF